MVSKLAGGANPLPHTPLAQSPGSAPGNNLYQVSCY